MSNYQLIKNDSTAYSYFCFIVLETTYKFERHLVIKTSNIHSASVPFDGGFYKHGRSVSLSLPRPHTHIQKQFTAYQSDVNDDCLALACISFWFRDKHANFAAMQPYRDCIKLLHTVLQ